MCVHDEDQALLILDAAFEELKTAYTQKSVKDLIGGVIAAVAGVKQVQSGLSICKSIDVTSWDFEALSSISNISKNPTKYFEIVEDNLLLNGIPILYNAGEAVDAYMSGDMYSFGNEIGYLLKDATLDTQRLYENQELQISAQVAQGFLSATGVGSINIKELLLCIDEADEAAILLD